MFPLYEGWGSIVRVGRLMGGDVFGSRNVTVLSGYGGKSGSGEDGEDVSGQQTPMEHVVGKSKDGIMMEGSG